MIDLLWMITSVHFLAEQQQLSSCKSSSPLISRLCRSFSSYSLTFVSGGTNKGSVRVPGHTAWVPESKNNDYNLAGTEIISNTTKDNFLITYRHNVPGYTGHNPAAVVNDHGPRNPGSKGPITSQMHAGLVLDSQR